MLRRILLLLVLAIVLTSCYIFQLDWDAITALATSATAIVAYWQISELRIQQRGWETLKACERYDLDPILDAALKRLRDARNNGDLKLNPFDYRLEIATVLNYFEGLATGIAQRFLAYPLDAYTHNG